MFTVYPLGTSITQTQSVLFMYRLLGGETWPVLPTKCSLHPPGGRVTGDGVVLLGGSILTDSDNEHKPRKKVICKIRYVTVSAKNLHVSIFHIVSCKWM